MTVACVKRQRYTDGAIRQVEVSRISADVAILTYVYDCKVFSTEGESIRRYRDHRASYVWTKRKGAWVLVFSQDTILPGGE